MPKIEGDLAKALTLLHNYFEQKGIPFALVGALVPAILLSSEIGARETRDADHVIKLSSWAEWETVIADLVKLGFIRGRGEQEHRLHYRTAEVDLIPYGITNGPDDVLVWKKSGNQMNMTGFADVFLHAKPVEVIRGLTLPVVPLWLFAVLKVVTYLDRKYPRDLRDLLYIMEQYDSDQARRFELTGTADSVTYENAGAYVLGNDIRDNASAKAFDTVKGFVAQVTNAHHAIVNTVLREMNAQYSDDQRKTVFQLIESFKRGLT